MKLALFDFDGTITRHDSFLAFAKFVKGKRGVFKSLIMSFPLLLGWKLRLCSAQKAKEMMFKNLYKGMSDRKFKRYCHDFSRLIEQDLNPEIVQQIVSHQLRGDKVVIVSASIADWIIPWAKKHNIDYVLATNAERDESLRLSGSFSTPNCKGEEKVRRIYAAFPDAAECEIWAYSDSTDDKPMLRMATHPYLVEGGKIIPADGRSAEADM